jgi:CO/xanthine dehydrogenase Mo-binding subunit
VDTATELALGTPPPAAGAGFSPLFDVHLSQTDMYDVPNRRIVNARVLEGGYLKTGPLRAPLDPSVFFALEGMMDELAYAAKVDPYEFRKRNISHPRWLGVLKAAPMRPRGHRVSQLRVLRRRALFEGAASGSARTTCLRTRAIASPTRQPSSRSK